MQETGLWVAHLENNGAVNRSASISVCFIDAFCFALSLVDESDGFKPSLFFARELSQACLNNFEHVLVQLS
jgi:hypothetical protein